MNENIIILGFLIFGGGFVITLLSALMKLLFFDFNPTENLKSVILKIFKLPFIFLMLLIIFIVFFVPKS